MSKQAKNHTLFQSYQRTEKKQFQVQNLENLADGRK